MLSPTNIFNILIIDDNPDIHTDFIKILAMDSANKDQLSHFEKEIFGQEQEVKETYPKFVISTASQGMEGIQKIQTAITEGNPFSLAFVDVRMPPGIDGVETCKQIWHIDQDIQIVICTA